MRKYLVFTIVTLLCFQVLPCYSQIYDQPQMDTTLYLRKMRPINLIDNPTANSISALKVQSQVKCRLYHNGGMLGGLTAKLSDELQFGITYGGQNVIGQGKATMNKSPGVNIRYTIKNMQRTQYYFWPEIALGFDSQGYGTYSDTLNRYQIKSKGLYVVASGSGSLKRTSPGYLGLGYHGGINYSLENRDVDSDINFFCGAHLSVDERITLIWEYDFGINDNSDNSLGSGKGYMNVGLRWYFSKSFILEFSAKNILNNNRMINGRKISDANRELKIIFFESINFLGNSK